MSTALFIAMCVLAIINILLYTFVAAAIHKRDLCQKSPYYHCDTDWICCMANPDSSAPPCDVAGVVIGKNAYYITDQIYGTGSTANKNNDVRGLNLLTCEGVQGTYYELCVLPVQNVMKNYKGSAAPDLACLYDKTYTCPPAENDPAVTIANPSVGNFTPGQCCYQKIDPDTDNQNSKVKSNLYPNGNNNLWNSSGLYSGSYSSPSDYTFPQNSNTDTKNNSCNNSFFSHINPYTNCPPLPS